MPDRRIPVRSMEELTRDQLSARVYRLREAMTELELQADLDGGPVYACIGRMRVTLIELEGRLRSIEDPHPVGAE